MNIVEYAEKIVGVQLLECQKQLLRSFEKILRDCIMINSRRGYTIVIPRKEINNEENTNIV